MIIEYSGPVDSLGMLSGLSRFGTTAWRLPWI